VVYSAAHEPATASTGSKRDAILKAALELFADRGFYGTAVPLVAERAGVGAGTVYRYFESKEALVNALYRDCKRAMTCALMDGFPSDQPTREQFRILWGRLSDFARTQPRALAFLELHHHAPYLDDESRQADEALLGPIRHLLAEAASRGVVKVLAPDIVIGLVFGAFVGLVKAARAGLVELNEETLKATEGCLWAAIQR
jgi:TetR/AcrR family transcriptional regulator, repressor of fatR-cypB operon